MLLPEETTIFTRMSALAQEFNALNLGQGFPDDSPPEFLTETAAEYLRKGPHQYAPMQGLLTLREALADKFYRFYGLRPDPETEITITAGGTQALFTAIAAFIDPGDEAIILEPAYDSYAPAVLNRNGRCVFVPLKSDDFRPNWEAIRDALTQRTRLLIINTPHNPSGAVWAESDYENLENLAQSHPFLVLSDEVYEHIVFDQHRHKPLWSIPGLRERCLSVYSFGKVFHCTGWKIGYTVAGPELTRRFRKAHQYHVFSVNAPLQHALGKVLKNYEWFRALAGHFQNLRDQFLSYLRDSRWEFTPASGTYFQLLGYRRISREDDLRFAEWLTREKKITTIPASFFYHDRRDEKRLRICFAKSPHTLQKAAEILCRI
ncbi:MAG: methionine aminotransferase [Flavobacteriales bacterium]|nr:methionine aminotransferase [Flavobacteriales bacterium]MCX7768816.1 methionine aminotransferase [Flavobacteriales bacterium]MDW8410410.1 methionine aminotransferase [Flavobacteriales bacterium]